MKTISKYIWNLLLFLFVVFWATAIIPRALPLLANAEGIHTASHRARVLMGGLQGFGLLISIAACAVSLMSPFWWDISRRSRVAYATILAALIVGTIANVVVDIADMGRASYHDYLTFIVMTMIFLAPLILAGRGYPSIILRVLTRFRTGKAAEPAD